MAKKELDTRLKVKRQLPDNGIETNGSMSLNYVDDDLEQKVFICKTLELPDKDNQHEISCIPVGEYDCVKVPASQNIPYPHISITNVPNRSEVCVHKANFVRQLRGCIAVGKNFADIDKDGQLDVTDSGKTFDLLFSLLPDKFKLLIQ